jgi:outer membrane lipoprotein SlyB
MRPVTFGLWAVVLAAAGCSPDYSPNTYSTNAVQQANKVEQGMVVGVRPVDVTASGAVGAVTGAAAGGIAGSQVGPGGAGSAFGALGGSLVGGLIGTAAEHTINDTKAYEYIVRKPNNDLVSVTQKDEVPLALGQKVLVIAGNQARIVPDYTTQGAPPAPDKDAAAGKPSHQPSAAADAKPADKPANAVASGGEAPAIQLLPAQLLPGEPVSIPAISAPALTGQPTATTPVPPVAAPVEPASPARTSGPTPLAPVAAPVTP